MTFWPVLVVLLGGATPGGPTLTQFVGEYEGIRPSIDTPMAWKLSIRADGTFHSELRGDGRPLFYDGVVKVGELQITLDWTFNAEALRLAPGVLDDNGAKSFSETLIPVRWGKRWYLITDAQSARFVRDVVRGDEPRFAEDGLHLLRAGDWKIRVSGRPEVPEDWKKRFPPDHFATRITRQLTYHRAEIGAGSRQGLAPGMLLTLFSEKFGATDLDVVSVTAGTAVIENPYGDPPLTKGTRGNLANSLAWRAEQAERWWRRRPVRAEPRLRWSDQSRGWPACRFTY